MNNNDITNLNEKLSRIKDATDSIRNTLGMTTSDVIENVASGVSILNTEKQELEEELEHAEERVLNEYFNINLDNTSSWEQMQKKTIPYEVNGLSNLASYFYQYPFQSIKITGQFGQPTSLSQLFSGCRATEIDMPTINTSLVTDFSNIFNNASMSPATIQKLISTWDTSNGNNFNQMLGWYWGGDYGAELDLSNFNMSNAQSLEYMLAENTLFFTGMEDWDVSNVDNFFGTFQERPNSLQYEINLSNWHNNKNAANVLSLGNFIGYNYFLQKCSIPNIRNDYRELYIDGFAPYDYHLMFLDIRGLTLPDNLNTWMLEGVSPFCTIIVKDDVEKQKLSTVFPNFKQIYTVEEFTTNNNLYTTFNLYLSDRNGVDISNEKGQGGIYRIQYYDENTDNWEWCWSNNGPELKYLHEGEPVILPYGYTYRFSTEYLNYSTDPYEVKADQIQKDIELTCGPIYHTIQFTMKDESGELIPNNETYTVLYKWDQQDWQEANVVGDHFSVQAPEGGTLYIESPERETNRFTFNANNWGVYEDMNIDITCFWKTPNIVVEGYQWEDGSKADKYNKQLGYIWYDENNHPVAQDSTTISYPTMSGTGGYNIRFAEVSHYTLEVYVKYDNITYYQQTYQYNEIPITVYIPMIVLPNPIEGILNINLIDATTGDLIPSRNAMGAYEAMSGSIGPLAFIDDQQTDNPMQFWIKEGDYYAFGKADRYEEGVSSVVSTVTKDQITNAYVYLQPTGLITTDFRDEMGDLVERYVTAHWSLLDENGVILWNSGNGTYNGIVSTWYPLNLAPSIHSIKVEVCDAERDSRRYYTTIPYVLGTEDYDITVQITSPTYTNKAYHFYNTNSGNLIDLSGNYTIDYYDTDNREMPWAHDAGNFNTQSAIGVGAPVTPELAASSQLSLYNLVDAEGNSYNEQTFGFTIATESSFNCFVTPQAEPEPENAHVTVEFDQAPNSVGFYDDDTGFEYEYEKSTAQTFELEVPIGITLKTQATCDGFEPVNDYTSIEDDTTITINFEVSVDITITNEDGEPLGEASVNIENYDVHVSTEGMTDGNGYFASSIPTGYCAIDISKEGYMPIHEEQPITEATTLAYTLEIDNDDIVWESVYDDEVGVWYDRTTSERAINAFKETIDNARNAGLYVISNPSQYEWWCPTPTSGLPDDDNYHIPQDSENYILAYGEELSVPTYWITTIDGVETLEIYYD